MSTNNIPKNTNIGKFISEKETMDFLQLKESSMRNLVTKKLLSKYQLGNRFFYDKNEITKLIESHKKQEQNQDALKEYENSVNSPSLNLKKTEQNFVISQAMVLLNIFEEVITLQNAGRDFEILKKCIYNRGNFEEISLEYDLSKERIRQIFARSIIKFRGRCFSMKREYDKKTLNEFVINEENFYLKNEIKQLTIYINKNLPKQSQLQNIDSESSVNKLLSTPIVELDLSVRALNCLKSTSKYNIESLGDIAALTKNELLNFRNFGKKTLTELSELLRSYGLTFSYKRTEPKFFQKEKQPNL